MLQPWWLPSSPGKCSSLFPLPRQPGPWHRSQKPCPRGKWGAPEKRRFCCNFPHVSSSLWVPGKDFAFSWFPPHSHSVALAIPIRLPAQLVSVEEREKVEFVWLPCGSQVSRGSQTRLPSTDAPSHRIRGQTFLKAKTNYVASGKHIQIK